MSVLEVIKEECKAQNISVLELERRCNFPRSCIFKWDKSEPGIKKLKRVADELGKPVDYFLRELKG